ncbi:hypothetical protein FJZ21_01425 [Candidatus Pacearchaeota archaeon]|nr:hypothetical protein [Candidatus Pacearchaeota archaeon]
MVTRNITSPDRYIAARMSAQLGLEVQRFYGNELVELVRRLSSVPRAVVEMNLPNKFPNASQEVVLGAARKALSGHTGSFGVPTYEGLMTPEERKDLYGRGLVSRGNDLVRNRIGIHGLDRETKIKNSGIAGKRSKELGRGVHGFTDEQNRINWILAAKARGVTLWSDEERAEAVRLSEAPEYMRGDLTDCRKLAAYLNSRYHDGREVRKPVYVSQALRRAKGQKKES